MVKRFMAPGPWITRDLKECVLASDYDALAAENAALRKAAWKVTRFHPVNEYSPSMVGLRSAVADLRALLEKQP